MINFTKLNGIIPDKGFITLTVKKNSDGTLGVQFKSKHTILKADSTYDKDLKSTQESIEKAEKHLDRVLAFSGSPEALTANFEEQINKKESAARTLVETVNETTEALNARIKELKDKKTVKTTPKTDKETKTLSPKEAAKPDPLAGGLFSSISTPLPAVAPAPKDEASNAAATGDETGEANENIDEESEELQEVA